jgi:hypothetical protein
MVLSSEPLARISLGSNATERTQELLAEKQMMQKLEKK